MFGSVFEQLVESSTAQMRIPRLRWNLTRGYSVASEFWKPTFVEIQDNRQCPNSTYLNHNNSAADFSIIVQVWFRVGHVTANALQTFKVNVKVNEFYEFSLWQAYTFGGAQLSCLGH